MEELNGVWSFSWPTWPSFVSFAVSFKGGGVISDCFLETGTLDYPPSARVRAYSLLLRSRCVLREHGHGGLEVCKRPWSSRVAASLLVFGWTLGLISISSFVQATSGSFPNGFTDDGWLGPFWSSKGEVGSVFTMWWAQCPACSPRRLRLHVSVQFGFRGRVESVFTMRWAQGPVGFSPTSSLSSGRTDWFSRRGVQSVFTVWWARGTAGFPQTLPLEVDVHQFWNSSCLHGGGVESVFTVGWAPGTLNVFTFGWALPCHKKRPSCGLFPVSADTAVLMGSRKYESEDAFAVSYGVTFSSVESGDRGTWLVLGPCSSDDTCAGEIP